MGGAPKEYDRTAALNLAMKLRRPPSPMTPEQQEELKEHGPKPKHGAAAHRDYLQNIFVGLGYQDAMKVWELATDEEKQELRPLLAKKRLNAIRKERSKRR